MAETKIKIVVDDSGVTKFIDEAGQEINKFADGLKESRMELKRIQDAIASGVFDGDELMALQKRAGELKDKMADLAEETRANAGNAFEGLNNNLELTGDRLMNLDFKGAGDGLVGMANSVKRIDLKTLREEIGGLIQGLGKLAKAVLSNPYLLLAAAVALIIANFDTIIKQFPAIEKGLTGINEEERKLLEAQTKKAAVAKKNYENISAMEDTLKRQGKSEKQIRDDKIAALEASILEAQTRLDMAKGQEKAQIETAKRNRYILEGFIQWINAPLILLLTAVDKIAAVVGQNTNLAQGLTTLVADLLIDPKQQQEDLQKSFQEQEDNIVAMRNSVDAFKTEQEQSDKDARDKRKKENEDSRKANQEADAEKRKLYQETRDAEIASEDAKYKALQEIQETAQEKEVTAAVEASEELYRIAGEDAKAEAVIAENLAKEIANIENKYATEKWLKEEEKRKQEIAKADEQFKLLQQLTSTAKENEINDAVANFDKQNELADNDAKIELANKIDLENKIAEINKKYADEEIKIAKEKSDKLLEIDQKNAEKKQAIRDFIVQQIGNSLNIISQMQEIGLQNELRIAESQNQTEEEKDVIRKKYFEKQKQVQVAQALLATFESANNMFNAVSKSPVTTAFPAAPFIASASAVALGLLNVAKIRNTQFSGGSGSASTPQAPNFNSLSAPQPSMNGVNVQGQQEQPVFQTYVVSGAITDNQELSQLIKNQSKL